ncbi:hypothetical protein [Halobacillus seohaensis]|uniref:Uncharacterized protein n=1 Tax=Halobacillus seohaensis TaxID=447421 RepID=A0ABW2EK61_9BACI
MNFVIAYISPLLLIALFFITLFFLMDGVAKFLLFTYIVVVMILPFLLFYLEEVRAKKKVIERQDD